MRRTVIHSAIFLFLTAAPAEAGNFIRADSNLDKKADISDAINTLGVLFLGTLRAGCDDAMDTNDDGRVDISDGVSLLNFLFQGAVAPEPPYPDCGADPTDTDPFGCGDFPGYCPPATICFDQAALEQTINEQIDPTVCIAVDQVIQLSETVTLTVCPKDLAHSCPAPESAELGCPAEFTVIEGTLDVPNRSVTAHIEGFIDDLPVIYEDSSNPGSATTCILDVTFSGDVIVDFVTELDPEGRLIIVDLLEPILDNPEFEVTTSSPEFLCRVLVNLQDRPEIRDQIIAQLETAASDLIADVRTDLVGQELCQ